VSQLYTCFPTYPTILYTEYAFSAIFFPNNSAVFDMVNFQTWRITSLINSSFCYFQFINSCFYPSYPISSSSTLVLKVRSYNTAVTSVPIEHNQVSFQMLLRGTKSKYLPYKVLKNIKIENVDISSKVTVEMLRTFTLVMSFCMSSRM
jgi:hypothetical protein